MDCRRCLKVEYVGPKYFVKYTCFPTECSPPPPIINCRTAHPKQLKRAHFDKEASNDKFSKYEFAEEKFSDDEEV